MALQVCRVSLESRIPRPRLRKATVGMMLLLGAPTKHPQSEAMPLEELAGRWLAPVTSQAEKLIGNKNSIYVVGDILGSKVHKSMFRGMCALSQPVELEHAETIRAHKTRPGSLEWWAKMAAGH
jgi:hypothetical protein